MAIPNPLPISMEFAFPYGLALFNAAEPVRDYDRSTKTQFVQAMDPETGLPDWKFECMDLDPDATKANRLVTVKMASPEQPVPPAADKQGPLTLVSFDNLMARAYVRSEGDFHRVAYSLRASGFASPAKNDKAA